MKTVRGCLVVILALIVWPAVAELAVIDLEHRDASDILPLVEPVAPEGVVIRGMGYRLVVRGDAAKVKELRALVRTLDTRPQSLRISVRTRRVSSGAKSGGGGRIGADEEGVNADLRIYSTQEATAGEQTQTVRALEGRPAFIDTGGTLLVTDRVLGAGRDGAVYGERRRTLERPDGFLASARVRDDRVAVELSVDQAGRFDGGTRDNRRIITTVRGPLGEWLSVGAVNRTSSQRKSGILRRSRDAAERDTQLELRVEIAD